MITLTKERAEMLIRALELGGAKLATLEKENKELRAEIARLEKIIEEKERDNKTLKTILEWYP